MPTVIVPYKNLIIKKAVNSARTAIILAHGGYTPKRNYFCQGSGYTYVPFRIKLVFNCKPDGVSIGKKMADDVLYFNSHSNHLITYEILGGSIIKNYSLTHNDKFSDYEPNNQVDIIEIKPHSKAHMSDVFEAINKLNLGYQLIYNVACRINKLDQRALYIESPTNPRPNY
ncbi:putative adhesin [Xenorhabdus ishibashii]|uniref:Putative adhesin Stv domain-containing protein n=1 Tax=Xenorhabdus ishibashii TaxID=1034471 RepID=A0A2D0KC52_9GAMM|nr:hypothetical protein [Xenorhabdus ishibashii]PHM61001.1 hypothetical protein Xish_00108 [Xenorhabdus ishibashii]